jgi:type I restriction enzyme S subunit
MSAQLGSIARFIRGVTFKPNDVVPKGTIGSVLCMRTKNVQVSLDTNDVWAIPTELVKRADQFLQEGDLLISSANSWNLVGKACWVPKLPSNATFGGFVTVLRPDQTKVNPRYLYHWFTAERTQELLRSFGQKTTNISNLNIGRCEAMEIPLPTFDEQRRIAAILDQAEQLRAKRRAAIALLDQLPWAIFLEMFGDPTTNPMGWPNGHQLADYADLVSGITKGRKLNGQAVREIPYMAVVNVQDKRLHLESVKLIEATEAEIARYRLRRDDLLLTEGGDPDKLGRGTLWNEELPEAIHQNHIFRVRINTNRLNPLYLSWLIGSSFGKSYFLRQAKQTTGIATINMGQLKSFPLLLPPADLQGQFADRVRSIQKVLETHQFSILHLDTLISSLQNTVFKGGE